MGIPILQAAPNASQNFFNSLRSGFEQTAPQSISEMVGNYRKGKERKKLFDELKLDQGFGEVTPEKLLKIYQYDPQMASVLAPFAVQQHKHFMEGQAAESEKQRNLFETESILNELEELKPYAGSTKIPFTKSFNAIEGGLNRPGLEKRSQIDPIALSLEGFFRDLSTKGQLPQKTFNELLKRIPKAEDSERVYQGKIDGIRKILRSKSPQLAKEFDQKMSEKKDQNRPSLEEIFSE